MKSCSRRRQVLERYNHPIKLLNFSKETKLDTSNCINPFAIQRRGYSIPMEMFEHCWLWILYLRTTFVCVPCIIFVRLSNTRTLMPRAHTNTDTRTHILAHPKWKRRTRKVTQLNNTKRSISILSSIQHTALTHLLSSAHSTHSHIALDLHTKNSLSHHLLLWIHSMCVCERAMCTNEWVSEYCLAV